LTLAAMMRNPALARHGNHMPVCPAHQQSKRRDDNKARAAARLLLRNRIRCRPVFLPALSATLPVRMVELERGQ
jgi:hypothetical protein